VLKGANPFAETGLTFGLILEEFVFRCLSLFFVFFIFFYFGFVCFVMLFTSQDDRKGFKHCYIFSWNITVTRTVVKRRKPRYKAKVYSHKDKTNKQTKTKNKTNKTKIKKNKKHKKQSAFDMKNSSQSSVLLQVSGFVFCTFIDDSCSIYMLNKIFSHLNRHFKLRRCAFYVTSFGRIKQIHHVRSWKRQTKGIIYLASVLNNIQCN
jgi:hypothetical protein